jgi:hypothetical protein
VTTFKVDTEGLPIANLEFYIDKPIYDLYWSVKSSGLSFDLVPGNTRILNSVFGTNYISVLSPVSLEGINLRCQKVSPDGTEIQYCK